MRGNLSTPFSNRIAENNFAARFAEVCGTSEPAKIQRLLKISYQAAKNYLDGRVPDTKVLMLIAEHTPYSIHWLLTGKGEKIVGERHEDTLIPAHQIRALIREECIEAVNELLGGNRESRVVELQPEKIRSEKISTPENVSETRERTRRS
jgi:hypothetical protein